MKNLSPHAKMQLPRSTKIIVIDKITKGMVSDGIESFPKNHFTNPQIGDIYEITLQGFRILGVKKLEDKIT